VVKLQIWDTCGQEFYRSLVSSFYRNTSLAIIVYAINNQKSFNDLDLWIKDLKSNSSPDIKIFLIGNKTDLTGERVISKEMANKIKEEYELDYFMETSAKTGFNTQELFIKAARVLIDDYNDYKREKKHREKVMNKEKEILTEKKEKKNRGKCC
jgi:small GTP-binding protein